MPRIPLTAPFRKKAPPSARDPEALKSFGRTAAGCLAEMLRLHGVPRNEAEAGAIATAMAARPTLDTLERQAFQLGFKPNLFTVKPQGIAGMTRRLPFLAFLSNGNVVLVCGLSKTQGADTVYVFDPLAVGGHYLEVDNAAFARQWTGQGLAIVRHVLAGEATERYGIVELLRLLYPERSLAGYLAISSIFIALMGVVMPLFFQIIIDKVLVHQAMNTLLALTVGVLTCLMFDAVFNYIRSTTVNFMTSKLDLRLSMAVFQKLLALRVDFFDSRSVGVLAKQVQEGQSIRSFLTGRVFGTVMDMPGLLIFMPLICFYSYQLALIVLGGGLVLAVVMASLSRFQKRRLRALYAAEGQRQAHLVEVLQGIQTVKGLGLEEPIKRKWEDRVVDVVRKQRSLTAMSSLARVIAKSSERLLQIGLITYGADLVMNGDISAGSLVAVNMFSSRVTGPMVQMISMMQEFQQVDMSARVLGSIMSAEEENTGALQQLKTIRGEIEFQNVSFTFNGRSQPALNGVNLKIAAGTTVGVVGRSGAGKSTLIKLIEGVYQPDQGMVRIDGADLRQIDVFDYRRRISLVQQDTFLFRGTVLENITMANPRARFEHVVKAAKMAGALEFIETLPQGFRTPLEENARNISGGQRQRIAIARALVRNPKILIFDEATSALDPESEFIIQQQLADIARGRTLLIISHRLSMVRNANAIVVVDGGRVLDAGTHDELIGRCEFYRKLWTQQAAPYLPRDPAAPAPSQKEKAKLGVS
ncbi:MAG: hypothetical protein RL490_1152 [Pseudomonadota bacterium]